MTDLPSMNLDFSKSATVWKFLHDKSFVRGLMGPVGSGKSYGCAAEIMLKAVQQKPSPRDGIRYSRFVIVRNTYPELRTTTAINIGIKFLIPSNIGNYYLMNTDLNHPERNEPKSRCTDRSCLGRQSRCSSPVHVTMSRNQTLKQTTSLRSFQWRRNHRRSGSRLEGQ